MTMTTPHVIHRTKLSEQIAAHLTDLIVDGTLPPLQALPTEREFAKQYGVSVGVIREAIRILATGGLVDVRHGVGSVVNPRDLWNTAAPLLLMIQSEPGSVLSVHDVRTPLEVMSAETAATMADPVDLAAIDSALERMTAQVEDPEANVAADLDFHLALAKATHNRLLLSILQSLIEPIHECMLRGTHVPTAARHALKTHRSVVDAIHARAPKDARLAMERHMKDTRDELMTLLEEGVDMSRNGDGGAASRNQTKATNQRRPTLVPAASRVQADE
jgi:DNA-binding FadR family transcriptional regulator